MDISYLAVVGTGIVITGASVVAVSVDRFQRIAASIFALSAGIPPWLFYFLWKQHFLRGQAISVFAMFGSGPLFLIAFFLYGRGNRERALSPQASAALVGMFAGIGFSLFLIDLLSRME